MLPQQEAEPKPRFPLEAIQDRSPNKISTIADLATETEYYDYANAKYRLEVRSLEQDIDERKLYAKRFFWMSCLWLSLIGGLLLLQGFGIKRFTLTDSVLIAAIGSTTADVLGFLYFVARYLFPKD